MSLVQNLKALVKKNKFIRKKLERRAQKKFQVYASGLPEKLQKEGYIINSKVYELLKGEFKYYAICGTLLGVVRENGFIKYDDDLDYGIIIDSDADWRKLYSIMMQNGFKFNHYFESDGCINEMAFLYDGIPVDFFRIGKYDENNFCFFVFHKVDNKEYKDNEFSTIKFYFEFDEDSLEKEINGSTFIVPKLYDKMLTANYDANYMSPVKNYVYDKNSKGKLFCDDELAYCKNQKDYLARKIEKIYIRGIK